MARTGSSTVSFEEAVDTTRTGDLWMFRGGTVADRLIQTASNAPVNHVGMAVVLDDLPPLMFTRDEIVALVAGARMVRAFGGAAMARAEPAEALVRRLWAEAAALLP